MGPLTAVIVDSIAYMMGAHHGFHGPWPVFREMLYWMFPVLLVALIVDIIAYNALKHSRSKLKTDAQYEVNPLCWTEMFQQSYHF